MKARGTTKRDHERQTARSMRLHVDKTDGWSEEPQASVPMQDPKSSKREARRDDDDSSTSYGLTLRSNVGIR